MWHLMSTCRSPLTDAELNAPTQYTPEYQDYVANAHNAYTFAELDDMVERGILPELDPTDPEASACHALRAALDYHLDFGAVAHNPGCVVCGWLLAGLAANSD